MTKYIVKRLIQTVPLLFLITVLCFTLMNLAPYDAVDAIANSKMTEAQREEKREELGLLDPLPVQYIRWVGRVARGDLGNSLLNHTSISKDLLIRIPNTIKLVLPSYATAYILAIVLGLYSASFQGKWPDKLIDGFSTLGLSLPSFWIAMIFIYFFGYKWKIFPLQGMQTIGQEGDFLDFIRHLVLPYLVLVIVFLPDLCRYVRSSAIVELRQDYVLVQNVLLPLFTKLGMALPLLVTGAVITESVFAWPGVGLYFVKAVDSLDYPIVMAVLLFSGTLVILGNLLSDILYALADPRIAF